MARGRRRQRGGFLIVTVLVLLLVVVTITSWMLRSASIRSNVVQRQINAYEQHHELMSVRHIALRWITRQRDLNTLEDLAGDPRPGSPPPTVYGANLPDGMEIRITLERGQGLPSRDLDGVTSVRQREVMEALLERIAAFGDPQELTRNIGPTRMVLSTTPDIMIEAIGAGRPAVADALFRARREGETNTGAIQTTLQNFGVPSDEATLLASELFTSETRLWKLTAYTQREGNRRVYRLYRRVYRLYMMQEAEGGSSLTAWKILEARLLPEDHADQASPVSFPARGASVR